MLLALLLYMGRAQNIANDKHSSLFWLTVSDEDIFLCRHRYTISESRRSLSNHVLQVHFILSEFKKKTFFSQSCHLQMRLFLFIFIFLKTESEIVFRPE